MPPSQDTSKSPVPFQLLWDATKGWLAWASIAVGVLSAVSAINRIIKGELRGIVKEFVEFYRGLLGPIYEFIDLMPLPFEVPDLAVDLVALYLVLFGMSWRAGPGLLKAIGWDLTAASQTVGESPDDIVDAEFEQPDEVVAANKRQEHLLMALSVIPLLPLITGYPIQVIRHISKEQVHRHRVLMHFPSGEYTIEAAHKRERAHAVLALLQMLALPLAVIALFLINHFSPI